MSFQVVARTYLQQLAENLRDAADTDEATSELSYRASLDAFLREVFNTICPSAAVILEPKRRLTGAPDFRVHDRITLGVYGFIEAKGPELSAMLGGDFLLKHREQIDRYRSLGYRVIATDGLDFFLFQPDAEEAERASLISKPCSVSAIETAQVNAELYPLLTKFLDQPTFRVVGEQGLVELSARHAREIARVVSELTPLQPTAAADQTERKTITRLHAVHRAVAEHLDPHLSSTESFGGFVAQVLAFSLLYAHRVEHLKAKNAIDLYDRLVSWGTLEDGDSQLRPFRELIRLLGDELKPGSSGDLGRIYDTLRTTLAYISLPPRVAESPEYHTLYESFLERFDKNLRDRYGAYYTPRIVADACVRLTLRATKFKNSMNNKVIEPCCGTGSFIDALQGAGVSSPITGLEVLPSAYALACFRQSMVKSSDSAVRIVLTNTMADDLLLDDPGSGSGQPSLFELERTEARTAIRPPVVLVIGNPPAKDVSTSDPSFCSHVYKMLEEFRPSTRTSRANVQKQTTSTAMQFLRWSAERVLKNGNGAISLLLPSSFIDRPSYLSARRWLKARFGRIWVLHIDGDARAGSQSNIFQVQQGRALIIAEMGEQKEVRYASITEYTKTQKLAWLNGDAGELLRKFVLLESTDSAALKPGASKRDDWERMSPLWTKDTKSQGIFIHQCSGVKLAPTSIFVNLREATLRRRILDLQNYTNDIPGYIEKWFKGQRKPPAQTKFTHHIQRLLIQAAQESANYRSYALRPFLSTKALISDPVLRALAKMPNSGTRFRPEHQLIFSDSSNLAIGVTPAPEDVSEHLGRPCVLIRSLPDNDLSRRGNIRVLAARSPGNKRKSGWGELNPNLNAVVVAAYSSAASAIGLPVEEAVVLYAYAVLSTQWFLDEWSDQLMECKGDNMPRIPLPESERDFIALVHLGQKLDAAEHSQSKSWPELDGFANFKLGGHRFEPHGDVALLDECGAVRWVVSDLGKFDEFETGGYVVVSETVKWMTSKYLRAEVSPSEISMLYELRETLRMHEVLQADLADATRRALTGPQLRLSP